MLLVTNRFVVERFFADSQKNISVGEVLQLVYSCVCRNVDILKHDLNFQTFAVCTSFWVDIVVFSRKLFCRCHYLTALTLWQWPKRAVSVSIFFNPFCFYVIFPCFNCFNLFFRALFVATASPIAYLSRQSTRGNHIASILSDTRTVDGCYAR